MNRNEIAVIICNYNGGEDTVKCIDAVIKSKDIKCDIYVVDNASTLSQHQYISPYLRRHCNYI